MDAFNIIGRRGADEEEKALLSGGRATLDGHRTKNKLELIRTELDEEGSDYNRSRRTR